MADKTDEGTIEIMYNESIRQYNLIMDSIDGLNTKAVGIIAFNGTLLSLFSLSVIQFFNSHQVVQLLNSQHLNILQIFLIFVTIAYSIIFISIIFSFYSYRVVEVSLINPKRLHIDYYLEPRKKVLDQLCSNISEDFENNKKIPEKQSKFINYSLKSSIIGVFFIIISLIYGFYVII